MDEAKAEWMRTACAFAAIAAAEIASLFGADGASVGTMAGAGVIAAGHLFIGLELRKQMIGEAGDE